MEYLIDCLLGIIGSLFAAEAFAWLPKLAQRIVERAVKRLPASKQERLREEWLAHLDECPGHCGKVYHAFGCLYGAGKIFESTPSLANADLGRKKMMKAVMEGKLASGRLGGITAKDIRDALIGIAELAIQPEYLEPMKALIEAKLASGRPGGITAKDMREILTGIVKLESRTDDLVSKKALIEAKLASGRPGGITAKDMRETLTGIFDLE